MGNATPFMALAPSLARNKITFATSVDVILGVSPTGLWSSQIGLEVLLVSASKLYRVGEVVLPKSSEASFIKSVTLLESFDIRFHS